MKTTAKPVGRRVSDTPIPVLRQFRGFQWMNNVTIPAEGAPDFTSARILPFLMSAGPEHHNDDIVNGNLSARGQCYARWPLHRAACRLFAGTANALHCGSPITGTDLSKSQRYCSANYQFYVTSSKELRARADGCS